MQTNRPELSLSDNIQVKPILAPSLLGNYRLLWGYGSLQVTLGPDYIIFFLSFIIVNTATLALLLRLQSHEETQSLFMALLAVLLFLDVSWAGTALINPGVGEGKYCLECAIAVKDQAHHLRIVGGCVGRQNYVLFQLMLLGLVLWGMSLLTVYPLTQDI